MLKTLSFTLISILAVFSFGLNTIGCATSQVGTADTLAGKYFQARVEYAQLLVIANEYKASPTANPEVVEILKRVDLQVQAVERQIQIFLENNDFGNAENSLYLYVALVSELKNQLISRGILKVEK